MIYVHIKKELEKFETDIRDLCLAFFTLQKITYVFESAGADTIHPRRGELCEPTSVGAKLCEDAPVGVNDIVGAKLCEDAPVGVNDIVGAKLCEPTDIIVKDYYTGPLTGDRLTIKSELKRQLYTYLSKLTGKTLLWGTLTGIRPVNIVTKMIEDTVGANTVTIGATHSEPAPVVATIDTVGANANIVGANANIVGANAVTVGANFRSPLFDEEIKNDLKKEYYISDLKANELIKIAKKEIEILNRDEVRDYKNSYSIYVGVPFCKSTCLYCSFTSFNIERFGKYVDSYLNSLEKDFSTRISSIVGAKANTVGAKLCEPAPVGANANIVGANFRSPRRGELCESNKLTPLTLYIGGGTPTSLSEEQFERILTIIDKYIDKSKCIEYTVEAGRPDTITKEKLLIMKKHGVSRISINPQSFNQKTLDLIGRKHTVKDVIEKFKLARILGFDNINMDIILGLPNEHLLQVLKTLNGIRKLKPDSFTVHSLALKRAARLNFELDSWTKNYYLAGLANATQIVRSDGVGANKTVGASFTSPPVGAKHCEHEGKREIDKMFKWSERLANYLHLNPYYLYRQKNMAGNLENVGYAKDGKECIYNIMMMSERHTVYGFGTATTKEVFYESDGSKRIESEEGYKSVIDYCKSFDKL